MVRSWKKNPHRLLFAFGALLAVLGLASGLALQSLSTTARADTFASDCVAGEGTSTLYTVTLTGPTGNDWTYTITAQDFADNTNCEGTGTLVGPEEMSSRIVSVLVETCEAGSHVSSTEPMSADEPTGALFASVDFSSLTLTMDGEYEADGLAEFMINLDGVFTPLNLDVDGPNCAPTDESPTGSATASETTSATVTETTSATVTETTSATVTETTSATVTETTSATVTETTSATVSPSASVTASTTASPTTSATVSPTATTTTTPGDTRTYDLGFRWSLVGWLGVDGIDVMDALDGDGDQLNDVSDIVTAVYGWNNADQDWMGFFPNAVDVPGANDLETLEYGEAYFIAIEDQSGAQWTVEQGP